MKLLIYDILSLVLFKWDLSKYNSNRYVFCNGEGNFIEFYLWEY